MNIRLPRRVVRLQPSWRNGTREIRQANWAWGGAVICTLGIWTCVLLAASGAWAGELIQIAPIGNPNVPLQINAYGGAKHGTRLKVVFGCPPGSTDCTWTLLPNGMIVSDSDPTLAWNAYGGAKHEADITLVNNCTPDLNGCAWTVRSDGLIVSKTDPQLAVNAYGGAFPGNPLKLVNNCAPQLDGCKWVTPRSGGANLGPPRMLYSADTNNVFGVNAYGGAKQGTELQVIKDCPVGNWDCMWQFQSDGMILSASSANLAWNAYGGAKVGTKVTLVVGCPANNSDCQWDLRPDGMIVSRTNPNLAVKAQGGPHHIAPLILVSDCTPTIPGCSWTAAPIKVTDSGKEVWGFADLHTHPASHLAFGADANGDNGIFHGKPGLKLKDAQSTIFNDLAVCLPDNHSSSTKDVVQDTTRKQIIATVDEMGGMSHEAHGARGAPDFKNWPAALSISHQQMHISDIRRAFDGGLRLLVASVTNNQLLHLLWHNGVGKYPDENSLKPDADFDFKSAIEQINFIKTLVSSNADWMEIVLTPQQARAAIQNGKLAVVLGLEMDTLTLGQILTLVKDHGIRSVIPIHLADNSFGGAAVYSDAFNTLTRFLNGKWFDVDTDPKLTFRLSNEQKRLISVAGLHLGTHQVGQLTIDLGDPEGIFSANLKKETVNYPVGPGGHQNKIGLLGNGDAFVQLMRTGILLDLAHMGEKSIDKALEYGELYSYPLMDSHTGLRNDIGGHSERDLSYAQAERIQRLGGVIGLGVMGDSDSTCDLPRLNQCFIEAENKRMWCEDEGRPSCKPGETLARSNCRTTFCRDRPSLSQWLNKYDGALSRLGNRGVALGTDANGFSPLFPPGSEGVVHYPFAVAREYSPPSTVAGSMGNRQIGSRVYSFNTDGMATFGMIPDFLEALNNVSDQSKAKRALKAVYHTAEDTIQMWEKVEAAAKTIPPPPPPRCSTGCQSCIANECNPQREQCVSDQERNPGQLKNCGKAYEACKNSCISKGACGGTGYCCGSVAPGGTCQGVCAADSASCPVFCAPGQTACSRQCVDLTSNSSNCGVCGKRCPSGQDCQSGMCKSICPANQKWCAKEGECKARCKPEPSCSPGKPGCPKEN